MNLRTWACVCASALLSLSKTVLSYTFPPEYTWDAWDNGYWIHARDYYKIAEEEPGAEKAEVMLQLITNEIIGSDQARRVGMVLSGMGEDAALPTAALLTDEREKVRWAGATILSMLGPNAGPALPALQSTLADSEETVRVRVIAARAIAEITGEDVFDLYATIPDMRSQLLAEVAAGVDERQEMYDAYLNGGYFPWGQIDGMGLYYYDGIGREAYRAFYQLATGTNLTAGNNYIREHIAGTHREFTGTLAIDRNLGVESRWMANGAGEHMTIDYGEEVTFNSVQIYFYASDTRTTEFELQVSTDGVDFQPALDRTSSSINAESQYQEFTFPDKTGRYLRLIGHSNVNGVIELQAFGSPVLEPPTPAALVASDNAFTLRSAANTNQNDSQTLLVKSNGGDGNSRFAFFRFDLSSLDDREIASGMLNLYFKSSNQGNETLSVHVVPEGSAETTWGAGLTWNGQPSVSGGAIGTYSLNTSGEAGSAISIGLASLDSLLDEDSNGEITLRLTASGGGSISFASSGNTGGFSKPTLTVEYLPDLPISATESSFEETVDGTADLAVPALGLFGSGSRHYPGRLDADLEWRIKEFFFRKTDKENYLTVADSNTRYAQRGTYFTLSTHNWAVRTDAERYVPLIWLADDPAFADRVFANGDTVAERYEAMTRVLSEGYKQFALHGLHNEMGSDQYTERTWHAIYQLHDYALDPVLKQRMKMFMDLNMIEYAQITLNGLRGGSKDRPKDGGLHDRFNGILAMVQGEWGGDWEQLSELPGFIGYRAPEAAVLLRWLGPTEPVYEVMNRIPGGDESLRDGSVRFDDNDRLRSSMINSLYRTPEYIIGAGMVDYKKGGWGQWSGVNFKNLDSIYMRAWEDAGDRWYAHDKDVLIGQRYLGSYYNGDDGEGNVRFTPNLEKVERDGWIFTVTPDGEAYAAVNFVTGGYTWNETQRLKLLPNDMYSPVIIQTGLKDVYGSFEDFQDAILAATLTVTADKVDYTGPNASRIEFFRSSSFIAPKVDGEPIDFDFNYNYRSPFIQNEGESDRVTVRYGDKLWIYDFENNTITTDFTGDLAVNGVPHGWLEEYGWTSDFDHWAVQDTDGDGKFAFEEYVAGTDPTNAGSVFKLESFVIDSSLGDMEITWPSVAGKEYYILESWDLSSWWRVSDAIAATPPMNTYDYTDPTIADRAFHRVAIDTPAGQMVDFSASQGYTNGSLNGQPGNGVTWTENTNGAYQVDAFAGIATIDSNDGNFRSALLDVTTGAATMATLITEFTITAGTAQLGSTITLLRTDFFTSNDGLGIFSMRQNDGTNSWNLQFFESSGDNSFFGSSSFNGALIGLIDNGGNFTDNESDLLRMTARHTLTDGQTQWAGEIKLENLETGDTVRTVSGQWDATTGFRDADKFLRLSSGSINDYGGAGATRVDIQRVIFTE